MEFTEIPIKQDYTKILDQLYCHLLKD